MSVPATSAAGPGHRAWPILAKMTMVEAKMVVREPATIFFGLVFPSMLLVGLAYLIPGFQDVSEDMGGVRAVDVYSPVALTLAMATTAVTLLPPFLAAYRSEGVLRRLATTPASPSALLAAQLIVNLALLVVGSLLAFVAAVLLLDVELPQDGAGVIVAFIVGAVACFSIGLLIAAVAKNGKSASGIGMVAYFPMLFFAGVWTPGDTMPSGLQTVAEFTPTGAVNEALTDAWIHGTFPSALHLVVLVAWTIVAGAVAARLFRWE